METAMALFEAHLTEDDRVVLGMVDGLRERLRFHVHEPRRWSGLLRRVMLARAIRGSNSIEGFTVSLEDAFAALDEEEPLEADAAAWAAVRGYRNAMTYVLQLAREESFRLSTDTLKSLHFMMQSYDMSKWPGRWRAGDVYVFDEENDRIVYTGPDSDLVPSLMEELVAGLDAADPSVPPPARAAMAHLNLVMIHPFKDGNGRMARCLQTLLLAREGLLAPEFCSIEEYLGRNEHDYYRVLLQVGGGSYGPGRDTQPWIRFCLTAHYRQALTVLRRSKASERLWFVAEQAVTRAGLPERCVDPLFYALTGQRLRNSSYRQIASEVSRNLASRDLAEMAKARLLEAYGEKRGRHYRTGEALRKAAWEIRREVDEKYPVDADPYALLTEVTGQEPLWDEAQRP